MNPGLNENEDSREFKLLLSFGRQLSCAEHNSPFEDRLRDGPKGHLRAEASWFQPLFFQREERTSESSAPLELFLDHYRFGNARRV